jgi:hypothetical protein
MYCRQPGCKTPHMTDTRFCPEHNGCKGCLNMAQPPFNYCLECKCPVEGCRHPSPCKTHQCKFCKVVSETTKRACAQCSLERCPSCFKKGCTLHYCDCSEYRGTKYCAKCYCACGTRLVNSVCPRCICECGERKDYDGKCIDCDCVISDCKNRSDGKKLCDQHRADCCEWDFGNKKNVPVVIIDGKYHFGKCPTVYAQCEAAKPSSRCVQVTKKTGLVNGKYICAMCFNDNQCELCYSYNENSRDVCERCTINMKCPVCDCIYAGTRYTAGCIEHCSICINFRCCNMTSRRDGWLNCFGLANTGNCLVHAQSLNLNTILSMWVRVNVLGTLKVTAVVSPMPTLSTLDILQMRTDEFNRYMIRVTEAKYMHDIAYAVGILLKLPRDLLITVIKMVKTPDRYVDEW